MKTTKRTRSNLKHGVFMIALVVLGSCTSQMSQSVMDKKAGLNGGFELVKNGLPVNWLCYTQLTTGSGDFDIYANEADKTEGKQSLTIDVRTCSDKGGRFSPGLAKEFEVIPGETYVITFKVKQTTTQTKITLNAVAAIRKSDDLIIRLKEPITDWQTLSYEYKVPASMPRIRFEISVLKPGIFQIDEVTIRKKDSASYIGA